MKIDNTSQTSGVGKTGRKRRIGEAEGDFGSLLSGGVEEAETPSASTLSGVQPMGMLEGLLSIQDLENNFMEQKKAFQKGSEMLDVLDQLRHGLLRGRLSTPQVQNLTHAVKSMQFNVSDPRLRDILGQIETRAAVELAKLEMNRLI